ncbi:MAG: hypothetical protein QOC81_3020 [Thermoanaerobaculia bacterium]|jgi:hypothetical protein|nr:hypothetical protein [Thermoanaerobaculia bacterium]
MDHHAETTPPVPRTPINTTKPAEPYGRQDLMAGAMRKLLDKRAGIAHELMQLDLQLEYLFYDLSSTKDDPEDVETYDGKLGVSREFVNDYQGPIGQLQWLDLSGKFNHPGDDQGNLSAQRWGSGALIGDDLFLTAGHCFQREFRSFKVPHRNGVAITSQEMAMLMCVCFNFQKDGATGVARMERCYPIEGLLELSMAPNADYAIVKLGRDEQGTLPGKVFGKLEVAKQDLTVKNAILCIIEHPNRKEKKVEAGHLLDIRNGRLAYNDIGTCGGASGSPILDGKTGEVVGVHVKGGSVPLGGFNSGTAIGAIRAMSKLITNL